MDTKKIRLLLYFIVFVLILGCGRAVRPEKTTWKIPGVELKGEALDSPGVSSGEVFDHSHVIYDGLLKRYTRGGNVDYRGLKADKRLFESYLTALGRVDLHRYVEWHHTQKLAFWINSYNAFTLKVIIDHYPIEQHSFLGLFFPRNSILQIPGVWRQKLFTAIGKKISLGEIEHEILRKHFDDPRIHFAIVCASKGCPDLISEAYRWDILNRQLDHQTTRFINNTVKGVRIDLDHGIIYLSKIFRWFGSDFRQKAYSGTNEGAVLRFIQKYVRNEQYRVSIESGRFDISYLKYDWTLNEDTH